MIIFAQQRNSSIRHWVFAVFLFACGVVVGTPDIAKAETYISTSEPLYESHTWNIAGSPYIISGDGFLDIQGDLTIEPGVTVRFSGNQSVLIRGPFTAVGTPEAPIIFTGGEGDTCGQNSWGGFFMNSPYDPSVIRYAEFRCGSVFAGDLGHYEFTQIDFETIGVTWIPQIVTTEALIHVEQGNVTIEHTVFSDIIGTAAVHNISGSVVEAQHNWWGDASGPSISTNPNGIGFSIFGDILYNPWIGQETIEVPTSTSRNPVIFIPGITGTEFVRKVPGEEDELIWLDILKTVTSYSDDFMLSLVLNNLGIPLIHQITPSTVIKSKVSLIGDRILFDYTGFFVKNLENYNYKEDVDLFLFPYDWRKSNIEASELLADRIEEIRQTTGAEHVDIIAHSMGGLVVKEYIRNHQEDTRIDKLIFLGTPHLGAPDAVKNLLFGGDLGVKFGDHSFMNRDRVKELALNMPSIYELLPSREYVETQGSVISDATKRNLYNFEQTRTFLRISNFNDRLFGNADTFHQNIDDLIFPSDMQVYSIEGCALPTTYGLVKRSRKFGADEWSLRVGSGDGTVPMGSASGVRIPASHHIALRRLQHSTMPSDPTVNFLIGEILTGTSTTPLSQRVSNNCGLTGKLISVHSPVEISLTDSIGNHVGKISDGDIEMGVEGVMYEELGENKFIFVPEPEEPTSTTYTIFLDGTATGTFNLRVTNIDSLHPNEEQTSLFLDVPVNANSIGSVPVTFSPQGAGSESTILYDVNGNGQVVQLQPDALTSQVNESDLTPPTTTAQVIGIQGSNQWYRSAVTTTLTAIDEGSGILRTMYSLDAGVTWNTYSQPLLFTPDGRYTIQYYSIDNVGNREDVKTLSLFIDKTPPEARFSFNPQVQDISIVGLDNMSSTTVSTTPNSYTIKDQAGNTLQLIFDEINRPIVKRASLNRLVYNGRVVVPNARLTSFVWLTNTRNEISSLQQALRYHLDEGLYALYTKLGGRTFIRERADWNTFHDRYENVIKIFIFVTDNGIISYY